MAGPCCECTNGDPLCNYTGNVRPNSRLGIPQIKMNDGCSQRQKKTRRRRQNKKKKKQEEKTREEEEEMKKKKKK